MTHAENIENQPQELLKKAKASVLDQKDKEKELLAKGWKWIKDPETRSHRLVPPHYPKHIE